MEALILTIIATSIPLLLAATGELITEKSGVLNLGVEGMMLSGAVGAFGAVLWLQNPYYGIVAGALFGALMASIFSLFLINSSNSLISAFDSLSKVNSFSSIISSNLMNLSSLY